MRHRKRGRKLNRNTAHRAALHRNMLRNLVEHEKVTTTLAKAKEIQPHFEKLITLARTHSLANIRRALKLLGQDRHLVAKLFDEIGPRYIDRPGGYTRLLKLAKPRLGDAAPRARLELVTEEMEEAAASKPTVVEEEAEDQAPVEGEEEESAEAQAEREPAEDEAAEDDEQAAP